MKLVRMPMMVTFTPTLTSTLLELDSVPARVAFHSEEAVVGRALTGSGLLVAVLI